MSLLRREETVFSSPAETPLSTVCERTAKVGVEGQILDFYEPDFSSLIKLCCVALLYVQFPEHQSF
jgi:hypothetical protein